MLKCVPFLPQLSGDTKLDVRAIYRRPSGDLTCGLPMRRHHQWQAKGFEYVTLADAESLGIAAPFLRANGWNPQDYVAGIDGDGRPTPWKVDLYLADVKEKQADLDAELRALIAEHGLETVEKIRGRLPEHLRTSDVSTPEPVAVTADPEQPRRAALRGAKVTA